MPHHKSAKKRVRQTKTRTELNKTKTSQTRRVVKGLRAAIESGDKTTATTLFTKVQSLLARMAKSGIIKDNNAARKTSRLASQISKL